MRRAAMSTMFALVMLGNAAGAEVPPVRADVQPKSEAKTPDPKAAAELKAKIKTLLTDALKAEDLWTALQLDAYAQSRLAAKPAVQLGATEIIGDPLWAFPQPVAGVWDRGESIGVVSGSRYFHLAPDGRPLALTTPLGLHAGRAGLSRDGRWLAAVERQHTPTKTMRFVIRGVPGGAEVLTAGLPWVAGDYLYNDLQVADDGSAATVCIMDTSDAAPRLFVVRANGMNDATLTGLWRPHGVGPGATWILAEPYASRGADDRVYALVIGKKHTIGVGGAVGGNGQAALVTGDAETGFKIIIAKADGTTAILPSPQELTAGALLWSVGGWLLVGSGAGGKTRDEKDLLGNLVKGGMPLPQTTYAYRWSDLAMPQTAQPAWEVLGYPHVSDLDQNLVYAIRDQQVVAVDFSGPEPKERTFVTMPGPIGDIRVSWQRIVVWMDDDVTATVFDAQAQPLWSGACTGAWVHDAQWLVVRTKTVEGAAWHVAHLDADPQLRTMSKLQLEPGVWSVEVDCHGRRVVATQVTPSRWVELDPLTGKARRQSAQGVRAPRIAERDDPPGRIGKLAPARLREKGLAPVVGEDPSRLWSPADAWRVSGNLLVLDQDGQVYAAGRKRGVYTAIGTSEGIHHFALLKDNLAIVDGDVKVMAAFAPGPVLIHELPAKLPPAEPLPPGPWRVDGLNFASTKSGGLTWDAVRAGFTPRWLRSPPGSPGLLVVTASLIIDLDPVYARLFGSPERVKE